MNKKTLYRFIKEENYLQNPPMDTSRFIKYAQKLGLKLKKEELKELERKQIIEPLFKRDFSKEKIEWVRFKNSAGEFTRPAYYGLKDGEIEMERFFDESNIIYSSFGEYDKSVLLEELKKGILYNKKLKKNKVKTIIKTLIYYSSFQIYLIDKYKRTQLKESTMRFSKFLHFMLFIQAAYFSVFLSTARSITVSGNNLKKWQDKMKSTNLSNELSDAGMSMNDLLWWYKEFSQIAMQLLGIKDHDWIQLWKNIDWRKKEKLEGQVRLGIEYLQWAVMLKEIIEKIQGKKILDIDEMTNISFDDILKLDVETMDQYGVLLRASRNKMYTEGEKNYYYDLFKRLFYLANDFGLDYQPRLMLFVEGWSEKETIQFAMEQYWGKPEHRGIEIVSLNGIDGLYGKGQNIKDIRIKKFVSNFLNLISYNLEKWQIIPYFIGDNENQIWEILNSNEYKNEAIKFKNVLYGFPKKWTTIWGKDYTDIGYKGNNFELVNFSNLEISTVLSEFLNCTVKDEEIEKLRDANKGISSIDKKQITPIAKLRITKKLFENLFEKFRKTRDIGLSERPIFKVFDRLVQFVEKNHPPTNTRIELENRKYIKNELSKK